RAELTEALRLTGSDRYSSVARSRANGDLYTPAARPLGNGVFPRYPRRRAAGRMTTTRRLAAILAADVAGYSRLMGADEEGTLAALKALRRELADPKEHRGRIVKTAGDEPRYRDRQKEWSILLRCSCSSGDQPDPHKMFPRHSRRLKEVWPSRVREC